MIGNKRQTYDELKLERDAYKASENPAWGL